MTVRKKRENEEALSKAKCLLSEAGQLISEHVLPGCPYHNKNT